MFTNFTSLTRTGLRSNNEDCFRIMHVPDKQRWMSVLCDGMGGHAMGEVASETVANCFVEYWNEHVKETDSDEKVLKACQYAMTELDRRADLLHHVGMGTTMVMASLENDVLTVAHIGDSRCYVMAPDGSVAYQTEDHTELEWGLERLTRCFFSYHPEIAIPVVVRMKIQPHSRILLCSDGLYKSMFPEILKARVMDAKPLTEILDTFDFLCTRSGDDNYTAVLAEVVEERE